LLLIWLRANASSDFTKRCALATLDKALARAIMQIGIMEAASLDVIASHVF
jgi:hypothetical protein